VIKLANYKLRNSTLNRTKRAFNGPDRELMWFTALGALTGHMELPLSGQAVQLAHPFHGGSGDWPCRPFPWSCFAARLNRSTNNAVPYSKKALRQDLLRVRIAWEDCQASRDRNAIYGYLSAVFELVMSWIAEGRAR
jgi:hypothetical protein